MTDGVIVRGTTPSLIVDFSGVTAFTVSDITAVALTVKQRTKEDVYGLEDMEVGDSSLAYHWTQEETLAMRAGDSIRVDMHVTANGERYKILGVPSTLRVETTLYNEVL
jgi:hypothetical protein